MVFLVKDLKRFQPFSEIVNSNDNYSLKTEMITSKIIKPASLICKILQLKDDETAFELRRLRKINGISVSIETSYIRNLYLPNIDKINFGNNPLYKTIELNYGRQISYTNEEILIVKATKIEAKLLNVSFGSHLTMIKGTSLDQDNIVLEYFESVSLPSLYRFIS
ncbi:MAG TPA: hypothetical protein DHS57_01200 [Erysipelotrichaceae bacterium]|nr:hypothetical protein [Erysipelotrichaceae bacterium]